MVVQNLFIIFLICTVILCSGLYYETNNEISTKNLQYIFQNSLSEDVVYTKVPRGLIISFDADKFFEGCSTDIKSSGYRTLDVISNILKDIPNYCVIEDHTTALNCKNEFENWEISAVRSSNIADYLMKRKEVPFGKIFYIGYGDIMPLKRESSSEITKLKNRVDFVIIDYEAKR